MLTLRYFSDPTSELLKSLDRRLEAGSTWVRNELGPSADGLELHFVILNGGASVSQTLIIVIDEPHVGEIMALDKLEEVLSFRKFNYVTYHQIAHT